MGALVERLRGLQPRLVVLEATGGYEAMVAAALVASRHNPVLAGFYKRLLAAGKPKKVALTAVMRKLLTILNAMIRDRALWEPSHRRAPI